MYMFCTMLWTPPRYRKEWRVQSRIKRSERLTRKHKTFVGLYHLCIVGPTSKTLGRRCTYVIHMFCFCWFVTAGIDNDPTFFTIKYFFMSLSTRSLITTGDNTCPRFFYQLINCFSYPDHMAR